MHYTFCSLDDEVWDIIFNFPGQDNLERTISQSDITVLNLLAMIEFLGYGIRDSMYYVKEKGKGKEGMVEIDSMAKVKDMVKIYADKKVVTIIVLKNKEVWPVDLNIDSTEAEILS